VPAVEDFVFGCDLAHDAADFVADHGGDLALVFGAASLAV
jgi:hypothetical protein